MAGTVSNDVVLRQIESGRHVFAMEEGKKRVVDAKTLTDEEKAALREYFIQSITTGRKTLKTEHLYAQTRDDNSRARGNSVALDNELDTVITDLRDFALIRSRHRDGTISKAAKRILKVNFPRGAAAITRLTFEQQLAVMQTMVKEFRGPLSDAVDTIGMTSDVDHFETLVAAFREELTIVEKPITPWDEVVAIRNELHEATSMVKIQVLAAFSDLSDPEVVAEREWILEPLRDQEARTLARQRRQRRPSNVDPETGEELEGDFPEDFDIDEPQVEPQDDVVVTPL